MFKRITNKDYLKTGECLSFTRIYLFGANVMLSMDNNQLIYQQILKPTYGHMVRKLGGCNQLNYQQIQQHFLNKVFKFIVKSL